MAKGKKKASETLLVNFAGREHVPTGKDSSGGRGMDEVLWTMVGV